MSKEISIDLQRKIETVKEMAAYCINCGKCLFECPTSLIGTFSPKTFLHNLVNGGYEDVDNFIKNEKLFNCLTCMQCSIYCPMVAEAEGIRMPEIVQSLREYGYDNLLLSDELDFNKTHDDIMQVFPKVQSEIPSMTNKIDFLKNNNNLKIADQGEIAYFIGCTSLMGEVFEKYGVKYDKIPESVITLLNENGINPVVLDMKCCGHDSYWAGNVETAKKLAEYNVKRYKEAGVKTIVLECAEGYRMWKYDYPKLIENFDFEVKHFSEFCQEKKLLKGPNPRIRENFVVTYHDPCRLGRLGGVYESPREVLKSIPGVELREMENIKQDSNCCGISNFQGCNSSTRRLLERRLQEAVDTGADYLVTACPKCITHFNCYMTGIQEDKKQTPFREQLKVIDLASFIALVTNRVDFSE